MLAVEHPVQQIELFRAARNIHPFGFERRNFMFQLVRHGSARTIRRKQIKVLLFEPIIAAKRTADKIAAQLRTAAEEQGWI